MRIGLDALPDALAGRRGPALLITRNNLALARHLAGATPALQWTVLTKDDFREGTGIRRLLRELRARSWSVLAIEDRLEDMGRRRDLYRLALILGRGGTRWLLSTGEDGTEAVHVPRARSLPRLLGELAAEGAAALAAVTGARRLARSLSAAPDPSGRTPPPEAGAPPRIAFIKTDFWFGLRAGGSISHALGVLGGMRSLGFTCRLWAPALLPRVPEGVEQVEVPPRARPYLVEEAAIAGYNRTFLRSAAASVRAFRPDLIYQRHGIFSLVGLALARSLGVPLVLEVNASEVWARRAWSRLFFGGLAEAMERTAFAKADRLSLISEELVPVIEKMGGRRERMVVNPNGVEVERFHPAERGGGIRRSLGIPEDAVVCGFLGTFTRWHGVQFVAEQVPELVAGDRRLYFLLIGDGDMRPAVERRLAENGGADRVRITGLLDPEEVPERLAACDILLSPYLPFDDGSPSFFSPVKLFEYMAAGRPVVASRLGQQGRVVEEGRTGTFFPPGDGPAFREAVLRLAADPGLRERMGAEARSRVEARYTWEANVRRAVGGLLLPAEARPGEGEP
jgi:glycosyltransferase involved in cell wall biosynthesis